jgi:hypothetical protein
VGMKHGLVLVEEQTIRLCVMLHVYKFPLILTCLFELKYSYNVTIFSFTYKAYRSLTKFVLNFRYVYGRVSLSYLFFTISYNSVTRRTTQELCNANQITSIRLGNKC